MNRMEYIRSLAVEVGELEGLGLEYWIAPRPCSSLGQKKSGYNGYVVFPERPVKELGYEGLLTYVPVHGGITLAEQTEDGRMVYGFDTLHHDSDSYPKDDKEWIKNQIRIMAEGIRLAASLEDEYLQAEGDNEKRAKIADRVGVLQPEQRMNFGVYIRLLRGEL